MTAALQAAVHEARRNALNGSAAGSRSNSAPGAHLSHFVKATMTTAASFPSAVERLAPASSNTPLWATVGVLGAAVLAMGGTLLYQQGAQSVTAPVAAVSAAPQRIAALNLSAPGASSNTADDLVEGPVPQARKVAAPRAPRPAPAPRYANAAPAPYPSAHPALQTVAHPAPQTAHYPASYPQASACASCGSVESVNAVQRSSKPAAISVGSVAGGVIGAALGNQVGRGNGRTLATVLGAVGGGYAGHVIEGQVRKETVYQVGVRMEDGSRRTIETPTAPAVGSRVTVDGNVLRDQQGGSYERRAAPIPVAYSQPAF